MAILQQPVNNSNAFADIIGDDLAPAGTYMATVLDVLDEFGVVRQKFESTEMEKVDLTTFLFGFRDEAGQPHRVASRRMKISGNEKSTLFAFLKSLLGRAPTYGWDYAELKGRHCMLAVEHVTRRDGNGVFAAIAALSPVPAGFGVVGATALPAAPASPAVPAAAAAPAKRASPAPAARVVPSVAPVLPPAGPSLASADDPIPF